LGKSEELFTPLTAINMFQTGLFIERDYSKTVFIIQS